MSSHSVVDLGLQMTSESILVQVSSQAKKLPQLLQMAVELTFGWVAAASLLTWYFLNHHLTHSDFESHFLGPT